MRTFPENTKIRCAFLLGLVPSFFFAETYAKKNPRLRGETGGRKRESWSGDPSQPPGSLDHKRIDSDQIARK